LCIGTSNQLKKDDFKKLSSSTHLQMMVNMGIVAVHLTTPAGSVVLD
jgi:hypothetical protein